MSAVPEGLTAELLATASLLMFNGQGGCGKTYTTTQMLKGRDFVVACPSNRLARRHARELQCRTATYHKLFGYNDAVEWDPVALGRKLARLPKTILWDEAGNVDKRVFAAILPELARRGVQVIFLMDPSATRTPRPRPTSGRSGSSTRPTASPSPGTCEAAASG